MKIDQLKPLGERQERVLVALSGGEKLKTSPSVVAELGLYEGMELGEDELAALRSAVKKDAARLRAARIVSCAAVSEKELKHRLVRKGETPENAEEAAEWLKGLHFLNDEETAVQLARSAARKGYGKSRIQGLLYEKGIPRELWEQALSGLPEPDGAIDEFLHKRFAGGDPDEKTVQKAVDALRRRGHGWQDIQNGLRRYKDGLELDLEDTNG
jgi:regulatory protein